MIRLVTVLREHFGCDLSQHLGFPVQVPFNSQAAGPFDFFQFVKIEIAEFFFQSINESEKDIVAIELNDVPTPAIPRTVEFHIRNSLAIFIVLGV